MNRSMKLNPSPMSLGNDYGDATNVVRMRPGSRLGTPVVTQPQQPQPQMQGSPQQYGGAWQWLTDKDYRDDYKAAREGDATRQEATAMAESMSELRDATDYLDSDEYKRDMAEIDATVSQIQTNKDPNGRRLAGKDAYVYWQNPDNSVVIESGPDTKNVGKWYSANTEAAQVVRDKYGSFPSGVVDQTTAAVKTGLEKFADFVGQFQPGPLSQPASQTVQKKDNTVMYVSIAATTVLGLGLFALAFRNRD